MQQLSSFIPQIKQTGGGRIGSSKLRASIEQSENFDGLEENTNRYDLLLLVKKVGKLAGFTPKMIELLDYYMAYTRDIDWEQGGRPLVYQALSKTALEMGVSERQIQNLEKSLFEVGAITWNDSGNHKRYGRRCDETGVILYAFGVDLSPLASLKAKLEDKPQEKMLYQNAWLEAKRQISYYRGQIKGCIEEMKIANEESRAVFDDDKIDELEKAYEAIAKQIRSSMDITTLGELLANHKELHGSLIEELSVGINEEKTSKTSSTSEKNFTHIESTKQKQTTKVVTSSPSDKGFQESSSRNSRQEKEESEKADLSTTEDEDISPIKATGLHHITPKQALNTATEEFRNQIPLASRVLDWNDLVEAAYKRKDEINIPQSSWGRACTKLTRYGAAICVLLTDRALQRDEDPVRCTGAYFNGMINKVESRELRLHKSIMGHLKSEA